MKKQKISKQEKKLIMKAYEAGFSEGLVNGIDSKDPYSFMLYKRKKYIIERYD